MVDVGLASLFQDAKKFIGNAYAKSTQASYRTHLRAFLRFCLFYELSPVPISQYTLLCYTTFLSRTFKASSISCYLNIIRLMHLDAGFANPLLDNFELCNLRRGIARQQFINRHLKICILQLPEFLVLSINVSRLIFVLFLFG